MIKTAILISNHSPLLNKMRIFHSTYDTNLQVGDKVDDEFTVDAILNGVY